MLWDIIQQMQLGRAEQHAASMEERLAALEAQVDRQQRVLVELVRHLKLDRPGPDAGGGGR